MATTIPGYTGLTFEGTHAGDVVSELQGWAPFSWNLQRLLTAASLSAEITGVKMVNGDGSKFNSTDKSAYVDLAEPVAEGRDVVRQSSETAIFEIQNGVNQSEYDAQLKARHDLTILEYGRNKAYIESESSVTLAMCLVDNLAATPSPHAETTFGGSHRSNYLNHTANYSTFFANDVHDVNSPGTKMHMLSKYLYAYDRYMGYPNSIYESVLRGGSLRGVNVGAMDANQIRAAGEAAWGALKEGVHRSRKEAFPYWIEYLRSRKDTVAFFEWNDAIDVSWIAYLTDLRDNNVWDNDAVAKARIATAVDLLL